MGREEKITPECTLSEEPGNNKEGFSKDETGGLAIKKALKRD
jgi:hypothetical protein